MKHNVKITSMLVLIFLLSQVVGLFVVNKYIDHQAIEQKGKLEYNALPYGFERPAVEEKTSFIYISIAVIIGTGLFFILVKYRKIGLWKAWFLFAVFFTLIVSFSAFMPNPIALALSAVLAFWKVFKPNQYVHNASEIFIYGGLAAIFVPIINVFSAFILLLLISAYDMFAVWKSKHMIKMAEFQTEAKMFAGLSIPYSKKDEEMQGAVSVHNKTGAPAQKQKVAILGGGDIGFPLLFAGAIMKELMLNNTEIIGFLKALAIPFFSAIALAILLVKAEKSKFYPAMPFISIGCVIGYLAVLLL